jgi:hypothetical protein
MFRKSRKAAALGLAGILSAVLVTAAYAAGMFSTLPLVASAAFCASTVSGIGLPAGQGPYGVVPGSTQGTSPSICGQTVPAGPSGLTGMEIFPADTELAGGAPPQTVAVPIVLLDSGAYYYLSGQTTSLSGTTNAIPNDVNDVIIDPTTTVSSMTLTMPTSPLNGQQVHITSSQTITALHVVGASGQTVSQAPTVLTTSTTGTYGYDFMWVAGTEAWYRLQ